jgi:hypothetical protein
LIKKRNSAHASFKIILKLTEMVHMLAPPDA